MPNLWIFYRLVQCDGANPSQVLIDRFQIWKFSNSYHGTFHQNMTFYFQTPVFQPQITHAGKKIASYTDDDDDEDDDGIPLRMYY